MFSLREHVRDMHTTLNPLLYSKTGLHRGTPIFFIFAPKKDCGYTLESPRRDGSNEYPQSMI